MSVEDVSRGHQSGVWSTERSCYEFLAGRCPAGSATLETGSGLSTALFAAWETEHYCITPGEVEVTALREYCSRMELSTDRVTFDVRESDAALPRLPARPLDLVLIDGGHGFPIPMIDWYYAAGNLRSGGVAVVDDLHLPAVKVLVDFLAVDPRWRRTAGTAKWIAFERVGSGPLLEDWYDQPFYQAMGARTLVHRVLVRGRSFARGHGWRPRREH